jgi:hypothetical protein
MSKLIDIHYSWYLVAYIDVLGQGDLLATLDSTVPNISDPIFVKKLGRMHQDSVVFLEELRSNLRSYFDSFSSGPSSIEVADEFIEKFREMRKADISFSFFSDSVVVSVCFETEKYHSNAINGVYGLLVACGFQFLGSLFLGKSLRCGIEVGLGTKMKSGEVYGPALHKAVHLEERVANYPRIIIGTELYNYLQNLSHNVEQLVRQDKDDVLYCKKLADRCLSLVSADRDGNLILDYLGGAFRALYQQIPDSEKIIKGSVQFVRGEKSKWQRRGEGRKVEKYQLLNDYFQRRLPENT